MKTIKLPPYNQLGPQKLTQSKKQRKYATVKDVSREFNRLKKTERWQRWQKNQFLRQGGTCYYCHEPLWNRRKNIEHIQPRSKGGDNRWVNLVLACSDCNKKKGSDLLSKAELDELFKINRAKRGTYSKRKKQYDEVYGQYTDDGIINMMNSL